MRILREIYYTQARGAYVCVQLGSTAVLLGRRARVTRRLELFTPLRWFRYSVLRTPPLTRGVSGRR